MIVVTGSVTARPDTVAALRTLAAAREPVTLHEASALPLPD